MIEAYQEVLLGGYPIVGVRIVLLDVQQHEKDSSSCRSVEGAWEAMREQVLPNAELELLEPIVRLEVEVPSGFQGGVVGNLTRKRAVFSSSQDSGEVCRIQAQVPLAECSITPTSCVRLREWQGSFTMVPDGYHYVPDYIANQVVHSDGHRPVSAG